MSEKAPNCLPAWCYYDEEFFQLEKQYLFDKSWLLVCHISDIPSPRDYFTLDIIGERVLIIRNHDHSIHAFHNICRHRGTKLLSDQKGQCGATLVCPFHNWTYQLDGKLIGVPAESTFKNLNTENHSLVKLDFEIWHGFIFVRFCSDGPTLKQQLQPIEDIVKSYQMDDVLPIKNSNYSQQRPYNWKVIHDIDNEAYHVPMGHPSLQQLYGKCYEDTVVANIPVSRAKLNDKPARLWSVKMYQNLLPEFPHLPKENQRSWLYIGLFPNTVFALYPDSIEYYMTIPISTEKTLFRGACYALEDNRKEINAVRYLNHRINSSTDKEDELFVSGIQQGIKSSVYPEPVLSDIESGVSDFHQRIMQILPVAKQLNRPNIGDVTKLNNQYTNTAN